MTTAAAMPARRQRWEQDLLTGPMLREIAAAVGGPFHLIHPQTFGANLRAFGRVFEEFGTRGLIRYGSKANKSDAFLRECADAASSASPGSFGVDVASFGEFRAALAAGVRGDEVVVTGPAPDPQVARLARRHRSLLAVDSIETLKRLAEQEDSEPLDVLLRIRPAAGHTRFGLTADQVEWASREFRDNPGISLRGTSFHLSGYAEDPRAEMGLKAVQLCLRMRAEGHPAGVVSLGGGLPVGYVEPEDWQHYRENDCADWYLDGKQPGSLYPYGPRRAGPEALRQILTVEVAGRCLADAARENQVDLMIEPGRALCAGAGSTVFTVRGVHAQPDGTKVITVDGTSFSMSEQWFDSEYLPDPVLYPEGATQITPASVAGASCLDGDMVSRRRIPFPRTAEPGDHLVYLNTAGYQMDSNESPFHRSTLPPKIVVSGEGKDTTWSLER